MVGPLNTVAVTLLSETVVFSTCTGSTVEHRTFCAF